MKDILNLKTSLPTLSPERFSLDFFGKYFDYKRDTTVNQTRDHKRLENKQR